MNEKLTAPQLSSLSQPSNRLDEIPTGELPVDYSGMFIYEIHTVGVHNVREVKRHCELAATSLNLSFIHLHEGDGVTRFQVKTNDPYSSAADLLTYHHWFTEYVRKYGDAK